MRSWKTKALALSVGLLAAAGALVVAGDALPAEAAGNPQFKVMCIAQRMAPDDPIVFPGQPGRSHMHTFFGARNVDAGTTVGSLLAGSTSACGANFGIDRSAYWVPTLYRDGQPVYSTDAGDVQLTVYYKRSGGASGAPIQQAFPQGLRMIAGDMYATTPQDAVWFKCARTNDPGRQHSLGHDLPSCGPGDTMILELAFPDCWDGRNLDSANHKSHMAYAGGGGSCPGSHPVKLPQVTFEVWYYDVNGDASRFALASGGPYTLHGDIFSAWDPRAFAGLVNECLNDPNDCTPLRFDAISMASVTQAQIDAQLGLPDPPAPAPPPAAPAGDPGASGGHGEHGAAAPAGPAPAAPAGGGSTSPAAAPTPEPTPSSSPEPSPTPSETPRPSSTPAERSTSGVHSPTAHALADTGADRSGGRSAWPLGLGLGAGVVALAGAAVVRWRRRLR